MKDNDEKIVISFGYWAKFVVESLLRTKIGENNSHDTYNLNEVHAALKWSQLAQANHI